MIQHCATLTFSEDKSISDAVKCVIVVTIAPETPLIQYRLVRAVKDAIVDVGRIHPIESYATTSVP